MSERFVIVLEDAASRRAASTMPPVEVRLRRALKLCLRFASLRAISVYEARPREETTARGAKDATLTKAGRRQLNRWQAEQDAINPQPTSARRDT